MKLFFIIIAIGCFSITSAQNCTVADYSGVSAVITTFESSLNQTNSLMNLIAAEYLYQGYEMYWQNNSNINLNMIANNFSLMVKNNTNAIVAILRGLLNAANNQTVSTNQSLIDLVNLISLTSISLKSFSLDGAYNANLLSNDIQAMLQYIAFFINDIGSKIPYLSFSGISPSTSNILRSIPSSFLVQEWIKTMQNISNVYVKYINTSATTIRNLYNIFRKSQSPIVTWQKMENQTYRNWSLATDDSQNLLNSFFVNFTKQIDSVYQSLLSLVPVSSLKFPLQAFAKPYIAFFNSNFQDFQNMLYFPFESTRDNLLTNDQRAKESIMTQTAIYYTEIFKNYMKNSTTLNCSLALLNATEAFLLNCVANKNGLPPKFEPALQNMLTPLYQGLNTTYTDIQKCLNTNGEITSTIEECLMTQMDPQLLEIPVLTLGNQYGSFIDDSMKTIIENAYFATDACIMRSYEELKNYTDPITENYNLCISKILN